MAKLNPQESYERVKELNKETAENYCTEDKVYVCSFSGGKDSVATYLYLTKMLKLKNVFGIFADTGWEHESTYEYVDDLIDNHGFKICKVQGSKAQLNTKNKKYPHEPLTMVELAKIKGRFPSSTARFCTTELKLVPLLAAYQLMLNGKPSTPFFNRGTELPALKDKKVVMVTGVRAAESEKRKNMSPFHYDEFFEIYKWMPIHKWSSVEVFAIHHMFGIKANPLYTKGSLRVGCYPCIMTNKVELNAMARHHSETFDKVREAEIETDCIFWAPDKTAKKYRSYKTTGKDGETYYIPTAYDVRDWALGVQPLQDGQELLFADFDETFNIDSPVCESAYGLCEVAMRGNDEI